MGPLRAAVLAGTQPAIRVLAVVVPLAGTTAARHIALFWRSDRYHSAAAQAFVETTAAVCRAQTRQPSATPLR